MCKYLCRRVAYGDIISTSVASITARPTCMQNQDKLGGCIQYQWAQGICKCLCTCYGRVSDAGYISTAIFLRLLDLCRQVGRLLGFQQCHPYNPAPARSGSTKRARTVDGWKGRGRDKARKVGGTDPAKSSYDRSKKRIWESTTSTGNEQSQVQVSITGQGRGSTRGNNTQGRKCRDGNREKGGRGMVRENAPSITIEGR